jgi:DNA-binding XRE family transcriptional regulator
MFSRSHYVFRCLPPTAHGALIEESFTDDFHEDAFAAVAVEFSVENLFPRAEVEFAICDGDDYFAAHDLPFQMRVRIVFAGAVVVILRSWRVRGQLFQPHIVIVMQTAFVVVNETEAVACVAFLSRLYCCPLPVHPTRWIFTQTLPNELRTIGDHIKARRIQLDLFQKDVARQIGVHFASVQNWERNVGTPMPGQIPGVIRFLGYVPIKHNDSQNDRLRWMRKCAGWTQDELATAARCGTSSIARLESGEYDRSMGELRRKVERALHRRFSLLEISALIEKASTKQSILWPKPINQT